MSGTASNAPRDIAPHKRLAAALAALHKALLNVQATGHPSSGNPFALWQAVMHHEDFAWLRPMSGLMARIDEAGAKGATPSAEEMGRFLAEADALVRREGLFRDKLEEFRDDPLVAFNAAELEGTLSALWNRAAH